jgi:phosphoribosylaminoimidazolecarboxamide formyltransferase/IMP cyclohydrolase
MNSKRYALLSVSNKDGLVELARELIANNYSILASDGTALFLEKNGISVKRIEEVTGSPELFAGRVKTLHPLIHGAILFDRSDPKQVSEAEGAGILDIDVVVVNLYSPEKFDIGGPALIRAAAKNHQSVSILTNPNQYKDFLCLLKSGVREADRKLWARQAIEVTARYDLAILREFGEALRYGENPHQVGVLVGSAGVATARLIQGKQPSFNNYLDLDTASQIVSDHEEKAYVIVKHGMPCGVAIDEESTLAFTRAFASDPVSAFGGVIASNQDVEEKVAAEIVGNFYEAVIAPGFTEAALKTLAKKPNLRVLELIARTTPEFQVREIDGGFVMQSPDRDLKAEEFKLVAGDTLEKADFADLRFAWITVARCRSNAIVIAKNRATIGIGVAQVNRLDAARDAIRRAGVHVHGAVAASDGFFPFPDGLEALAASGIKALVAPSGSIRDNEVIEAANKAGISLYFAARRHFSHN